MKRGLWALTLLLAGGAARAFADEATPSAVKPPAVRAPQEFSFDAALEKGWWWDLDVDVRAGLRLDRKELAWGTRLRVGPMYMSEPWYLSVGPTVGTSGFAPLQLGAEAELMNLWFGFWGQLGGNIDLTGRPAAHAAIGYSLLGIEGQVRPGETSPTWVLSGKLRVPISWLLQLGKPSRIPPPPVTAKAGAPSDGAVSLPADRR